MAAAASPTTAAHTFSDLERISATPGNRVLTWAEPGERRGDALSAAEVEAMVRKLQRLVVDTVRARPGMNELMLRLEISSMRVDEGTPSVAKEFEGTPSVAKEFTASSGASPYSTWADFAAYYPTFWSKITSASSTRRDMLTIAAMVAARRDFEEGRSAAGDEKELEALIQGDILALNMDKDTTSGPAGGAEAKKVRGAPGANSTEVRRALEQARLRRTLLERRFADVCVPTEELAAAGIAFAPARSCIHEIVEEHAAREKEAGAKKGGKKGTKGDAAPGKDIPLPVPVVRFARRMLELRVNIAKERGAMPEELEPKGASFIPTFVRSAQVDLAWQDQWIAPPQTM